MSKNKLGVAEAIENLRTEIQTAIEKGAKKDLRFELEEIELQLQCTLNIEGSAKAGGKLWFVNAEGSGKVARGTLHTLKFKVKPVYKGEEGPVQINKTSQKKIETEE